MSSSTSIANGARLDDCHSSIFALADLTGIKWRKFSASLSLAASPCDDPVLVAFSKCLSKDILAVWRRAPNPKKFNSLQPQISHYQEEELNTSASSQELKKELWIFWWGDEPSVEEIIRISGLMSEPEGSWEDHGLSYECRTLLFKAIHNLVERCLLSENFVRLGKWFLHPYNKDKEEDKSERLSCSFTFFLRGETTVCTTAELARHQFVQTITNQHLQQAINSNTHLDVLLSPYGLKGSLTGVSYKSIHEPAVKKVLEEWKPFYPIHLAYDDLDDTDNDDFGITDSPVPPVVEVILAGVRMNYPSVYVLVPCKGQQSVPCIEDYNHRESPAASINPCDYSSASMPESPAQDDGGNHQKKTQSVYIKSLLSRVVNGQRSANPSTIPFKATTTAENLSFLSCESNSEITDNKNSSTSWPHLFDPFKSPRHKMNYHPNEEDSPYSLGRHKYPMDGVSSYSEERRKRMDKPNRPRPTTPFHHINAYQSIPTHAVTQEPINNCYLQNITLPPYCQDQEEDAHALNNSTFVNIGSESMCGQMFYPTGQNIPSEFHNHTCEELNNNLDRNPDILPENPQDDSQGTASSMEQLQEYITLWKKFKLPIPAMEEVKQKTKKIAVKVEKPALMTDGLDPQHVISPNALRLLKRMNNDFCDVQRDWSWSAINYKRRKLEEKSAADESEVSHSIQFNSDPNTNESQQVVAQHVTVGAVTGELAGMTVPSDPYDFEEDEKDLNFVGAFSTSAADINLKQVGTWANRNNSLGPNKLGNNEVSTSHLESLLTNTNMPLTNYPDQFTQPSPAMENSNLNKLSNNISLTDKKDIQVSLHDLNHIFNESEEDDNGMPTPPDDHQDDILDKKVRQNTTGVIETCLPDLHIMFPTPPSMEQQVCSPEGKSITNVPKCNISTNQVENVDVIQAVNGLPAGGGLNYYDDRETRRLSIMNSEKDVKSLSNNAVNFEENRNMQGTADSNPSAVFSVTPLCKLPLPANYLPVKNLPSQSSFKNSNKLPQHVLYTPSWQIPLDTYMDITGNTNIHAGGNSHYNCVSANQTASIAMPPYSTYAQMPASVSSLHSPANFSTPARTPRGENVMASPASSIATPATGGRAHQLTPSVASSAAQSDIYASRASSIYVNLMLSDSVMNLFRDVSFEQCTICVCNNNINGRDVDLGYLPSIADNLQEGQYPCSCGFSAVRNRCLSVGAGLFLEDELEIVGKDLENMIVESRHHNHKISDVQVIRSAIEFSLKQSSNPFMRDFSRKENGSVAKLEISNIAVQLDIMEACMEAINGGISVMEDGIQSKIKLHHCKGVVHQWHTSRDILMKSSSSADEYRILQYLKPVLQDAIQKLRPERSYSCTQLVKGPLTWREFCKDNSFASEPLPVPLLLVGHDLDWMTVSPFALNFWEKLYLEPFAGATNIAYIVVCPDVENVLQAAKSFFYELSSLYEHCRLGNHKPYLRILQDSGLLKVKGNVSNSSILPDWYTQMIKMISTSSGQHDSDVDALECVKQYAQACTQNLVPLLTSQPSLALADLYTRPPQQSFHQTEPGNSNNPAVVKPGMIGSCQSISRPPTPLPQQQLASQKGVRDVTQVNLIASKQCPSDCATIVLYFVDPFSSKCNPGFLLSIWNCYTDIIKSLPEPLKSSVVLQLVPVEDILQTSIAVGSSSAGVVRSLAFSSYVQSRRRIPHNVQVRSMTAFGPAASHNEAIAKNINNLSMSSIYAPPFTLAIFKNKQRDILEQSSKDSNILYVSYCLSHDQKWLLASASDQSGEMLETFCVNIEVPPRRISLHRRQRACIKSEGIQKLWSLCMGAITRTAFTQWRIVIGRLGRLGHGEIQEWSKYLNRSSNHSVMSEKVQLKCNQCKLNGSSKHTNIISACLTSLEPEGSFSIFPDFIKSIGRFGRSTTGGTQMQLKTPEDASCSHIYVFPTSSFVQAAGTTFQNENIEFGDLGEELGFALPDLEQDDLTFMDAFDDLTDPSTSPNSHPHSADDVNMKPTASENMISQNGGGEETTLLQQPLALGYLVSTAPTGPLPDCFWASCPHAKYKCPVFLKFALHIQASKSEVQNGSVSNDNNENCHQLDSHRTAEVLRYVMENYNALSWLTCNPVTRDRRSCLPLHYFVLARLYNTVRDLT